METGMLASSSHFVRGEAYLSQPETAIPRCFSRNATPAIPTPPTPRKCRRNGPPSVPCILSSRSIAAIIPYHPIRCKPHRRNQEPYFVLRLHTPKCFGMIMAVSAEKAGDIRSLILAGTALRDAMVRRRAAPSTHHRAEAAVGRVALNAPPKRRPEPRGCRASRRRERGLRDPERTAGRTQQRIVAYWKSAKLILKTKRNTVVRRVIDTRRIFRLMFGLGS